jgi:hypothetical protein
MASCLVGAIDDGAIDGSIRAVVGSGAELQPF